MGPRGRSRRAAVAVIAACALAAITAVVLLRGSSDRPPRVSASPSPSAREPTPAAIYTALAPSVVTVEVVRPGSTTADSSGTGVVVNANALIVTALHVVKVPGTIRVTFGDGTASEAAVLAADPAIDIAVLAPATLPSVVVPAVLGRSDRLAVGDSVIAIGNQLGLTRTTTTGVVSGLDRQTRSADGTSLSGLIQFDAAVNPGSSGGPLVNGKGEIVGIVVALANPTAAGTFIGVGFAVPIGTAVATRGGDRVPQQ